MSEIAVMKKLAKALQAFAVTPDRIVGAQGDDLILRIPKAALVGMLEAVTLYRDYLNATEPAE